MMAQAHPYLSAFTVQEGYGTVELAWTMIAGSTCEGTSILRSTDSADFHVIGVIEGICGAVGEPLTYTWTDGDPLELTRLHYRLELGANGLSSIVAIDVEQLIAHDRLVFPCPADDRAELRLRVASNTPVVLRIHAPDGRLLHEAKRYGAQHPIDLSGWDAGVYVYEAIAPDRRYTGRLVKR